MSRCQSCGNIFSNPSAKFCSECGHDNSWPAHEVDRSDTVKKYVMAFHQLYFDVDSTSEFITINAQKLRERFKITFEKHETIIQAFESKKSTLASMLDVQLDFDENVIDAYAGHDTHLCFRITNPAGSPEMFKVTLDWDDPDTPDHMDYKASSSGFIKPGQQVEVAGTHVFSRSGPKEIAELFLTIENQFFDKVRFLVSPFRFKVGNAGQQVVNNITTHNQISIEGRGVVDASGAGTEQKLASIDTTPRWKRLQFTLIAEEEFVDQLSGSSNHSSSNHSSATESIAAKSAPIQSQISESEFDESDIPALFRAAEQGNATAQQKLGKAYRDGKYIPKDLQKAIEWFTKSALQGYAPAQNSLGWHYQYAQGIDKNVEVAFDWYQKAYAGGFEAALINIANCYEKGEGTNKDELKAFSLMEPLAVKGNSIAQYNLGRMYLNGIAVIKNSTKGADWYEKSAIQGYASSQFHLANLYSEGNGVPENKQTAAEWYLKAAHQGHELAQRNLAFMYDSGDGIPQDQFIAFGWFEKAALQGDAPSQYALGFNYEHGEGTEQNLELAFKWYQLAADQGNDAAKEALESLNNHGNDSADEIDEDVDEETEHTLVFNNGDTYDGPLENGLMQGIGTYTFSPSGQWAGQRYEGAFWENKFHGLGIIYYPNGEQEFCIYRENKKLGEPEKIEYQDGGVYYGLVEEGAPHGFGQIDHADGDVFIGGMKSGQPHGIGRHNYSNGTYRLLVFNMGNYVGDQEEFTFNNGDTYLGTLADGKPNGFGEYRFSSTGKFAGHIIFGQFVNGLMHGFMDSHYPDGSSKETVYVDGQYAGEEDSLSYNNGDSFIGVIENGLPEKYGAYFFSDEGPYAGHIYRGEFKAGKFHGRGVYSYPDGTSSAGNYVDGVLEGSQQPTPPAEKKGWLKSFKDGFKEGYDSGKKNVGGS